MWRGGGRFDQLQRALSCLAKPSKGAPSSISNGTARVCGLPVRWSSGANDRDQGKWKKVYEGPLSKPVRLVKMFSLSTAAASLIGSPIIVFFGKQSVPYVGKLAIAAVMCFAGCGTTTLLHLLTKSYVHQMYFDPDSKMFAVETLSLFCRQTRSEFSVDDIALNREEKLFSSFRALGRNYFIHQELVEGQQVLQYVVDSQREAMGGGSSSDHMS